jgi:hypothetical protein
MSQSETNMRWAIIGLVVMLGAAFIWPFIRKSSEASSDWAKRQQDIDDNIKAAEDFIETVDIFEEKGKKEKKEKKDKAIDEMINSKEKKETKDKDDEKDKKDTNPKSPKAT